MKTKHLLLGLTLILSLLMSNSINAQTNFDAENLSFEWTTLKEANGLKFSVQKMACSQMYSEKDLIYVALKVENTTNASITFDYNFSLIYDEACSGCEVDGENRHSMTIPANSTIAGDCGNQGIGLDRIIENPNLSTTGWELKGIDIKNINLK